MDLIPVNEFAVVRWFVVQLEGGQYHGLGAITLHSSNWASRSRSRKPLLANFLLGPIFDLLDSKDDVDHAT